MSLSADTVNRLKYALASASAGQEVADAIDGETNLANGKINVGNASGVAAEVTPGGDVSMNNAGNFALVADKLAANRASFPANSNGNTTLLAASASRNRTVLIQVTPTANFADGNGAQPTFSIGQGSNNNSIAATAKFTNANTTLAFTFQATLGANNALVVGAGAGTGTATGAVDVAAVAVN